MQQRRATVYRRVSLDRNGEGAAVERQLDECAELIKLRGWSHVSTFTDNSISAAGKSARPGFEALLKSVSAGEVDMVVAWALDRLTRNRADMARLVDACREHGVSVALVRGPGDLDMTSAMGRGLSEILATLARIENEQKSERQVSALAQRRRDGKPWGPIPAFGYAADRVTIVETEAKLIRQAYRDVLAGKSCRAIAREWNEGGVRTHVHQPPRGRVSLIKRTPKPWSGAAVKRVLINPRYMGRRGTTVGISNRRDMIDAGPACWKAIVDEDLWKGAHAVLTDPQRSTTTQRARVHLLPGIARCGICGAGMRSFVHSRGWPAYSCATSRHLVRKAAPVEELIEGLVIARLAREDARDLLVDDDRPDAAELRAQADALRARMKATRRAFADDDIMTPDDLREVLDGMRQRLIGLEEQMSSPTRAPVLAELIDAEDVEAVWNGLTLERKRAVIETLLTVTIMPVRRRGPGFDPETVDVAWRMR